MKNPKLLLIAIIVSSIFIGCKKDDDEIIVEPTTVKLLKKETHIDVLTNGRDNWTDTYNYEGSKLTSITTLFDGETESYNFTYDGDKIIKITSSKGDEKITYTGDLLTKTERTWESFTFNYKYEGSILRSYYSEYTVSNNTRRYDFAITWTGNNTTPILVIDSAAPTTLRTYTYTFDDKKSPYTNLNKYFRIIYSGLSDHDCMSANNILTQKLTYSGQNNERNFQYKYTYDEDGYPTKREKYDTADNSLSETITYEYIKVTL